MPLLKTNSLRSLRIAAGLSVDELARRANVSSATILREEDAVAKKLPGGGNIDHAEQARIAAALGTNVTTLRA